MNVITQHNNIIMRHIIITPIRSAPRCLDNNCSSNRHVGRTFLSSQSRSTVSRDDDHIDEDGRRWRIRRRVAVTGLGAITPLGHDMKSTWDGVIRSRQNPDDNNYSRSHGITSLYRALKEQDLSRSRFEKEWDMLRSSSCQVAASVPNEWITNHPYFLAVDSSGADPPSPPWLDGRTSRFVQLALIAAQEAIRNSGLDVWLGCHHDSPSTIEGRRESYGVCIGNGMSSTREIAMASESIRRISPHFVPRILPNSPSARVAIHNRLMGPNLSHVEACAAGAAAVAQAVELIRSGGAIGMIAGGCESSVDALGLAGFGRLRALSSGRWDGADERRDNGNDEHHPSYQSSSRPFDTRRDGFVLAEGAAMLVLEEYDHAIERGATILAEVIGVGYSGDAFHITAPEPTGGGAARAMLRAVDDAGIGSMDYVDYVNTHATSTPIGDVAEINAIRLALSRTTSRSDDDDVPSPLLVSSTKGATGHLLGAAGALEAALTAQTVSENFVPHTRNLDVISNDIAQALEPGGRKRGGSGRSIHLVKHEPISQPINVAMSNSFGFGGTNVSLIFGKA